MDDLGRQAAATVRDALADLGLEWSETREGVFGVRLPGTRKLLTDCALEIGAYALGIRAFVARRPDENERGVYKWLLEQNLKLYAVSFSLDAVGDIHLTGKIGLESVTAAEIDRVLGVVAAAADDSFNTILELGFAESIAREWVWRRSRGEPTANLAAFAHLDPSREES